MSFTKSLMVFAIPLALLLTGTGHAGPWGSGGSIQGVYKTVFNERDLFCDLDDPRSTAIIDAKVSPLLFRFEGTVVCWEIKHDGVPETDRQTPKVLFTLIQQRMDGGLEVSECRQGDTPCADGGAPPTGNIQKRTTWAFRVEQGQRNENLLWRLIPADQTAIDEFCKDQNDHPISAPYCGANFGLDEHKKATSIGGIPDGGGDGENANDYPPRDVSGDGMIDLLKGEIFRFTTETTTSGDEQPKDLFWGPCHSGQYSIFTFPGCEFAKGAAAKPTRAKGKGRAKRYGAPAPEGKKG